MKLKLLVVAVTMFAAVAVPTLAEAQEQGPEVQDVPVTVTSIRVNRFNDVRVYLSAPISCGEYGSGTTVTTTNTPYILDNHIGAEQKDMLLRVLMSAFLAGREVQLSVIRFNTGSTQYCGIRRVRIL